MILTRIRPVINPRMRINQKGFKVGRTRVAQMLALRRIIEEDTLAPFLFVIVLDYTLRKATFDHENLGFTITPRKSRRIGPVTLTDLDFADDIYLL